MGNSTGDAEDYQELIQRYPGFCGGFVWEWCDHAVELRRDENGRPCYGYGGDFGEFPHDGNFCVDGLVSPDRIPHTSLLEYKNVIRPARAVWADEAHTAVRVHNYLDFLSLDEVLAGEYEWSHNGRVIAAGRFDLPAAGPHGEAVMPCPPVPAGAEDGDLRLRLVYRQRQAEGLIPSGLERGFDQLVYRAASPAPVPLRGGEVRVAETADGYTVSGPSFTYFLEKRTGLFGAMLRGKTSLLRRPMGWNIWRAPLDNDQGIRADWEAAGYDRAAPRAYETAVALENGLAVLSTRLMLGSVSLQRILDIEARWTVDAAGTARLEAKCRRNREMPPLPRLGIRLFLPPEQSRADYTGYGPHESYCDKHHLDWYGRFTTTAEEMHTDYIRPQENGSRWGCTRAAVTDESGRGFCAAGDAFSFSLSLYTQEELQRKAHNYELEKSGAVVWCLDGFHSGIGSASCGPALLEPYTLHQENLDFSFTLQPLGPAE